MGSKDWNVSSPYLVVAQNHQNIWCCKKSWHHPHPTASTPVSRLITEEECKKSCFLKKSSAMPFGKICQRGNTVEQIDKPQPSGCRPSCDTPLKWKIARIVQIFKYICRNTKIQFTPIHVTCHRLKITIPGFTICEGPLEFWQILTFIANINEKVDKLTVFLFIFVRWINYGSKLNPKN